MKDVNYMAVAEEAMKQIKKGVFLTVKAGDQLNTMTIGWATIGICWHKPIFMVAVRDSRHTFGIIEKAADFTVSIPSTDLGEAVKFCGTRSGRDVDKFDACHLTLSESREVTSPIIYTPGLHFECKIMLKTPMNPEYLNDQYDKIYPQKDYHTLYFGEIMACYELD